MGGYGLVVNACYLSIPKSICPQWTYGLCIRTMCNCSMVVDFLCCKVCHKQGYPSNLLSSILRSVCFKPTLFFFFLNATNIFLNSFHLFLAKVDITMAFFFSVFIKKELNIWKMINQYKINIWINFLHKYMSTLL